MSKLRLKHKNEDSKKKTSWQKTWTTINLIHLYALIKCSEWIR